MTDDIRHRLEAAGRRPVPEPGPEFAAALESRLRAVTAGRAPADVGPPNRRWGRRILPGRWPRMRLTAGVVVLAVVMVAVAVAGGLGDRGTQRFELTGATNVEVALTDGTTLVNPEGLLLPDGAVVRVGVDGSARIGDVQLDAGDIATVADRRLRIDRAGTTGLIAPGDSAATATPVAPTTSPTRSPTEAPPASGPAPTPRPTDTASGSAKPSPDRPTPSPTSSLHPSSAPTVDAVRIKLSAKAIGPAEVGALWSGLPKASSYVLVASASRQGPAAAPRYPGSTVIGEFAFPPKDPLRFRVPLGVVEIRLMVVARTADGAELARSNIVVVELGD